MSASTKFLADPSMIGTSSPLISIIALSISEKYKAANKCSTVETLTPLLFFKVVQSFS